MIRKFLMASAGAIALTGSAALAADLPSRAPPPVYLPPVPIFTWTGIYLGGQIGYAWSNDNATILASGTDLFGNPFVVSNSYNQGANGVIGGVHVGYNYQINQWVLGLEGSVDGTSLSKTVIVPVADGFGNTGSITATARAGVQGSIRGRIGIAWDRVLLYGTGGVAFSGNTLRLNDTTGFFTGIPGATANFSNTRVGWTVGGGIEYAVTHNWSVRAEYRYSDFGHISDTPFAGVAVLPAAGLAFTTNHHWAENQVQVGFSYKFDTFAPAPVVAKY
jgi:outer membrane immunogenic protein